MSNEIFVSLINNAALLLALVVLYDLISHPKVGKKTYQEKILTGSAIGIIGIAVMMNSWHFNPGVVFDTRSILLSVTGLFFGPLTTMTAGVITAAFRVYTGGAGMYMGVSVVVTSSLTGLIWRMYRQSAIRLFGRYELYVFGLTVHVLMICCIIFLPQGSREEVFKTITTPVMAIYPVATVLMGYLLDHRNRRIENEEKLQISERRFRRMMERSSDIISLLDADGNIQNIMDSVTKVLGYDKTELIGLSVFDFIHTDDLPTAKSVFKSLIRSTQSYETVEVRFRHKNGEFVWIETTLSNMLDDPDIGAIVSNSRDTTARKAAEAELGIIARRLKLATEAGEIGIWEYDLVNGVLLWDYRMYTLYDVPRDMHVTYDVWLETIHADDRKAIGQDVQDAIDGKKGYHTQFRITCKDGSIRYIEAHGEVYCDAEGVPLRMVGVNWDITGRMEAERYLKESEARFRSLVENAPDAIFVQTEERFAYINEATVRLLRASNTDQLIGQSVLNSFHPDYRPQVADRMRRLNQNRQLVPTMEETLLRTDGSTVDVEVSAVPIRYGGKDGALVFVRDITDRKRAEQSLKESEEQYRQLFNTMMNGFALHEIICDTSGAPVNYRFLEVNPAFERLTGLKAENIIGRTVLDVMPGTEPVWIERYGRVALTGVPAMFENESNELATYYHVTAYSPRPGHFAVIFEDVSERKRAEEDRERMESQLRQAQKMEAVGRLAGGVAHDFNNMLNVILGNAEIALTRLKPEDSFYMELSEIKVAGERSAALTRQLLAFSRKQLVEPKTIDLNAEISNQKSLLERLIGEEINIVFLPMDNLWSIRIDPYQIGQILTNLAINSRDAIKGVGTITIETANVSLDNTYVQRNVYVKPGEYVMLSFTDSGTGMDSETVEQIFEPFFTTKKEGHGTGLGLSTVYGIVRQNSGVVNVYSERGMGTTFKIYFPRYAGKPGKQIISAGEKPMEGNETILIVEDEEQILELTRKILEKCGYRVLTANSPADASHIVEEGVQDIHLLLTDVVMPTMNGKELRDKIRNRFPGIKTLFMSGYTANVIAERGVIDKDVNFIHKPFTISGLAKKVREVLDREIKVSD